MVEFEDIEPVSPSIIMVVGVGGGGGNAVNHMAKLGIADVSFMVCNTDQQALNRSPLKNKIPLGQTLTEGLGAGNKPERGRAAAEESIEEIKAVFRENNTKMVFVTAGMGGGTGTGAAPVIAKAAKEMGILTVAIVTIPFKTEGKRRIMQALEGIEEIRHNVDSLLVINNENIHEIYGDLTLSEAFGKADDILATAAKSIADIITQDYRINVDFADVQTVMKDSGIALMGSARGSGENRALEVAEAAVSSPLLNHRDISGAKNVLLNITSGNKEVTLTETYQITEFVQQRTHNNNQTDLIWGAGTDETLGDDIRITVIATGFDIDSIPAVRDRYAEVVGKTPSVGGNVSGSVAAAQPTPKRETISLVDLDNNTAKKKPKVETDGADDFAVVTHHSPSDGATPVSGNDYGAGYGQASYAANYYANPAPQPEPVVVDSPVYPPAVDVPQDMAYGSRQAAVPSETETGSESVNLVEGGVSEGADSAAEEQRVEVSTPTVEVKEASDEVVAPVTSLTEEELENIPAFIRRRMKVEAETLPAGSKVSRETLKSDSTGSKKEGGDLFN